MKIASALLCRASEKIYEKLVVRGVPASHDVCAIFDEAAPERTVPCGLFPLGEPGADERTLVAVSPIVDVPKASYAIAEYDEHGRLVQSVRRTIDYEAAKWTSRLNYKLRSEKCAEIRLFDEGRLSTLSEIVIRQIIPDQDMMIVRGSFRLPSAGEHDVRLACLDEHLEPTGASFLNMGERRDCSRASRHFGLFVHDFSVRLPISSGRLFFFGWDECHPGSYVCHELWPERKEELLNEMRHCYMSAGLDPYYAEWLRLKRPNLLEQELQRRCELPGAPSFSLVVPLFQTPANLFAEMVDSVRAQTYARWELVLVNASPENAELSALVERACTDDERIRCVTLEKNLGISGNTNAGIERATGDFVAFLDHDDFIEPDTLFEYAQAVSERPDTDLLYCDEDILDLDGVLKAPFFKPDLDVDLLRTKNYITHLLTVRRSLLAELEPSTPEFDGAQDHHMTLQAVERARRVTHVPRVLYHWRVCEGSSCGNPESKLYAVKAGILAVSEHLKRCGISAHVEEGDYPFTYRVLYDVPQPEPLVSVVIPSCDHADVLRACIDSLVDKTTYQNYEIVVVENNSREQATFDYYESLPEATGGRAHVVRWDGEGGFNYSKLINFGVRHARGEYLLLLNNDTVLITPEWMERFVGICARGEVGAAGALLYYPDDVIQHAGVVVTGAANHLFADMPIGNDGYFNLVTCQRQLSAVTAACMMVRRDAFERVGGFEEALAVSYNDVDFCLKLRNAGYVVVYTPEVRMYHHESLSRGHDEKLEEQARHIGEMALLRERWPQHYAKGDPYFSPNVRQEWPLSGWYHF